MFIAFLAVYISLNGIEVGEELPGDFVFININNMREIEGWGVMDHTAGIKDRLAVDLFGE